MHATDDIMNPLKDVDRMPSSLRDWFAGQAMLSVMTESQEMVPASFLDWLKSVAFGYGATFLHVEYRLIAGVHASGAERAYLYADAMMVERAKGAKL